MITLNLDRVLLVVLFVSSWASFYALKACGVHVAWAALLSMPASLALTLLTLLALMTIAWLIDRCGWGGNGSDGR